MFIVYSVDDDSDTLSECRGNSPSMNESWSQRNNSKSNINQYASLNGLSNSAHEKRSNYSLEGHRTNSESGNVKFNNRSTQSVNEITCNGKTKHNSSSSNFNINARVSPDNHKSSNVNNYGKSNGVIHRDSKSPKSNLNISTNKNTNINIREDKNHCNGTKSKTSRHSLEHKDNGLSDETHYNKNGSAGQGSPLRTQLGLKLKSHHNNQNIHQV